MLFNCDQERAIRYVRNIIDRVSTCGDIFQLVLLNALRRYTTYNPLVVIKEIEILKNCKSEKLRNRVRYVRK